MITAVRTHLRERFLLQPPTTFLSDGAQAIRPVLFTICVFGIGLIGLAAASPAPVGTEHRARARLVSEQAALVKGKTSFIGLTFEIDPGWHLYWDGASDSGMPITFKLEAPRGVEVGTALWPAPKRHVAPGDILDYIYEKRVTLLVPVTLTEGTDPQVTLKASVSWMVCRDVCLAEETEVSLKLPIAPAGTASTPTPEAPLFAEARRTIPQEPEKDRSRFTTQWEGRTLRIQAPGSAGVVFYARSDSAILSRPIRDGESKGDALSLELEPEQKNRQVTGVLEVRRPGGAPSEYYSIKVPLGGAFAEEKTNTSPKG